MCDIYYVVSALFGDQKGYWVDDDYRCMTMKVIPSEDIIKQLPKNILPDILKDIDCVDVNLTKLNDDRLWKPEDWRIDNKYDVKCSFCVEYVISLDSSIKLPFTPDESMLSYIKSKPVCGSHYCDNSDV